MSHPPQRRRVVAAAARKPPTELRSVRVVIEEDADPDISYLEQDEFEDRLAAHKSGEFHFVGIHVEAEVLIASTVQVLTSPGIWGVESDTDEAGFEQIAGDEWLALRDVLKDVGIPTDQLPLAPKHEWFEWRT